MDIRNNPYSPGAGRQPTALVGRGGEMAQWEMSLMRLERNRTVQPLALYGLRGVGKTVLLNRLFKIASERNWYCAIIEATSGKTLREQVAFAFDGLVRKLTKPKAKAKILRAVKTILNFKASLGFLGNYSLGIDLGDEEGEFVSSGNIENDLLVLIETLVDVAEEDGVGVCLLIDETQELSSEDLSAISYISHYFIQRERKFTCAIAGLPTMPAALSAAKSYAERLYSFINIGKLSPDEARQAVVEPAESEGVEWEFTAVSKVVEISDGYPYFLQGFSASAWDYAQGATITESDVEESHRKALASLDLGFYKARWDNSTPRQKRYMSAMAQDNDAPSSTAELAKRLNLKPQSTSVDRNELIRKGLLYSPNHGEIAFTVPKMAEFVKRQVI